MKINKMRQNVPGRGRQERLGRVGVDRAGKRRGIPRPGGFERAEDLGLARAAVGQQGLRPGLRADLQILASNDERSLGYEFAGPGPAAVVWGGRWHDLMPRPDAGGTV